MADLKISQLPSATTPLAGTEVLPIVQSSATKQVSIANLTAGRSVSVADATLTTGNLVIGTAGKGIDFSADGQAAGMTSELLNDYEEGTWTPVYSSGVTSPVYTGTGGYYTKIGRTVFFTFRIQLSGGTADANQVKIGGLPFTVSSGTGNTAGASVAYNGNFKTDGAFTILTAGGSTELSFWTFTGGALTGTATNIGNTLQAYGFYTV